jgi:hypothetical protein
MKDDVVFWIAIVWLLCMCGGAAWMLSSSAVY